MPLIHPKSIKRAIANVTAFGDTDVFPFPFENWLIKERTDDVVAIVQEIDANFEALIESSPPQFESTLVPAGYTGFRWATQIDPFWNLYLLSLMVSVGDKLEIARVPLESSIVHSYRFDSNGGERIFLNDHGWSSFMLPDEVTDARELSERLLLGIPPYIDRARPLLGSDPSHAPLVKDDRWVPVRPTFIGVGLLDNCEGDLRFGGNLVEVKSGERNLRSSDFRQVLIYFCLSVITETAPLNSCLLLNPRQGYRIYLEFNDLVAAISGLSTVEFVAIFRDYLVDWKECD